MTIQAIDHVQVAYPAGQESAVRDFYGRLVGLSEIGTPGQAPLRFRAGRQRIDLLPTPSFQAPAPTAHLAFQTNDLAGLRQRLLHAGHTPDESRPLPGHSRLYVSDPAGNLLEFLQPEPAQGAST